MTPSMREHDAVDEDNDQHRNSHEHQSLHTSTVGLLLVRLIRAKEEALKNEPTHSSLLRRGLIVVCVEASKA
jgi:hypothetical protein